MTRITTLILLFTVVSGSLRAQPVPAGHWEGAINLPTAPLQVQVDLRWSDGEWEGRITIPAQALRDYALGNIQVEDRQVDFVMPDLPGRPIFRGELSAKGDGMAGEFTQGAQTFPFKLERTGPVSIKRLAPAPQLGRPQDPKKPYPYLEEEVAVENSRANVTLAGTLTVPEGDGPFHAVALITGSGPQDRNEALMGHRPFLVLADHLTRHGIAVLRCDDRGTGKSTGDFSTATHEDFASDALACVEFLKEDSRIDGKRIGLIGHSEGGITAPLVAADAPDDVAFVVLLAGVGVPMEELLLRQGTDVARLAGVPEDVIVKSRELQKQVVHILQSDEDSEAIEKRIHSLTVKQFELFSPEQRKAMGMAEADMEREVNMATSPWFRKLVAYDPRPTLRRVKCPVLALNGEKDVQVAARENLEAIRAALTAGGNQQVEIRAFPELNHLFQHCQTGAITEYSQIEETFAPEVLHAINYWINHRSVKR